MKRDDTYIKVHSSCVRFHRQCHAMPTHSCTHTHMYRYTCTITKTVWPLYIFPSSKSTSNDIRCCCCCCVFFRSFPLLVLQLTWKCNSPVNRHKRNICSIFWYVGTRWNCDSSFLTWHFIFLAVEFFPSYFLFLSLWRALFFVFQMFVNWRVININAMGAATKAGTTIIPYA